MSRALGAFRPYQSTFDEAATLGNWRLCKGIGLRGIRGT